MAYTKTAWVNGTTPAINASNLNHIETGIDEAHDVTDVAYRPGGTNVAMGDGGTGATLVDPNADRILFWDDSAGVVTWLAPGTNMSISGTSLDSSGGGGGGGTSTYPYEYVSDANVTLDSGNRNGTVVVKAVVANRVPTLPLAASHDQQRMTVMLAGDSTAGRKLVVTPSSGDTIHFGSADATIDIDQPGAALTFQAVASEDRWLIVAEVP